MTVAALYVERGGVYWDLPDVDPWDEARDARLYAGPWPVVAHPPCHRWSLMLQCNRQYQALAGRDGGCFAAALATVRRFGGVLEHPAHSRAWDRFGLAEPARYGWTASLGDPGWTCEVDQALYGHLCRKPTWLYYVGPEPPPIRWGYDRTKLGITRRTPEGQTVRNASDRQRNGTPLAFRDVLLAMARSALPSVGGPFPEPERLTTRPAGRDGC